MNEYAIIYMNGARGYFLNNYLFGNNLKCTSAHATHDRIKSNSNSLTTHDLTVPDCYKTIWINTSDIWQALKMFWMKVPDEYISDYSPLFGEQVDKVMVETDIIIDIHKDSKINCDFEIIFEKLNDLNYLNDIYNLIHNVNAPNSNYIYAKDYWSMDINKDPYIHYPNLNKPNEVALYMSKYLYDNNVTANWNIMETFNSPINIIQFDQLMHIDNFSPIDNPPLV